MKAITEDLLRIRPKGNRPGTPIKPEFIVVHRTGDPGASAKNVRRYFDTETNDKTFASSHYIIDSDGSIICCVPETELAYHCKGQNQRAIGIEVCEPLTGEAYVSLLELVVDICNRYGWPADSRRIKPHSEFDNSNRPYDPWSWAMWKAKLECSDDLIEPKKLFYEAKALQLQLCPET